MLEERSCVYDSMVAAVALNSVLVFINPSQLLGSRDGTAHLWWAHMPVSNAGEVDKSTAS